ALRLDPEPLLAREPLLRVLLRAPRVLGLPDLALLLLPLLPLGRLHACPFVQDALPLGLLLGLDPIVLDLPQLAQRAQHGILTLLCHTRGSSANILANRREPSNRW